VRIKENQMLVLMPHKIEGKVRLATYQAYTLGHVETLSNGIKILGLYAFQTEPYSYKD
jgi:hypothetical protein